MEYKLITSSFGCVGHNCKDYMKKIRTHLELKSNLQNSYNINLTPSTPRYKMRCANGHKKD